MYNTTVKCKLKANTVSEYRWKKALSGVNLKAFTERENSLIQGRGNMNLKVAQCRFFPLGGVQQNAKFINLQVT